MATSTVEDYVKAIYMLQQDSPTAEATVARLAATLGVTKGSVTSMVRKLRDSGLVNAQPYSGITLRPKGEKLAIDMIRRHRLIEVFLVETLGFDWSEVHEEAERMEHALSSKVIDRLDAFLGHPTNDPHGDPIPDSDGRVDHGETTPLDTLGSGSKAVVSRVMDQDPAFLEFAARHGLTPGARIRVVRRTPEAGSVTIKAARKPEITISLESAANIETHE